MKPGNEVRIVQPVLSGTIKDSRYDSKTQQFEHEVHFPDGDGVMQQRWFPETQLEILEKA